MIQYIISGLRFRRHRVIVSISFKQGIRGLLLLSGKFHGWRSLVGCSPWGRWGLDTTEQLHFHFSLSCIGEGNGNPLQCSCLENPRDGGARWGVVYGVAQSGTWLKQQQQQQQEGYYNLCREHMYFGNSAFIFSSKRYPGIFLRNCL